MARTTATKLPIGVLTHLCVPRGEGMGDGDGVTDSSKARTTPFKTLKELNYIIPNQ